MKGEIGERSSETGQKGVLLRDLGKLASRAGYIFQLNLKKTEPSSKARNCELHKIRVSVILRELRGISEDRGCVREEDVWLVADEGK